MMISFGQAPGFGPDAGQLIAVENLSFEGERRRFAKRSSPSDEQTLCRDQGRQKMPNME
jgi:hypothetical protein